MTFHIIYFSTLPTKFVATISKIKMICKSNNPSRYHLEYHLDDSVEYDKKQNTNVGTTI